MPIHRTQAMVFAIGAKGYIVCGLEVPISTGINPSLALTDRPIISPNPCVDILQLQFEQVPKEIVLQLADLLGRQVDLNEMDLTLEGNLGQFNTQDLVVGIYFLAKKTELGVYSDQVVVQ